MNYTLSYTVDEKLQRESMKQYFFKVLLGNRWLLLVLLLVFAVVMFFAAPEFGYWMPMAMACVAIVQSIMWLKSYLYLMRTASEQLALMDHRNIEVEFDDREIRYVSSNTSRKISWDKVEKVKDVGDFVVLMSGKIPLLSLPKEFLDEGAIGFIKSKA